MVPTSGDISTRIWVLIEGAGLSPGPSLGQFYAGSYWQGTAVIAARTTSVVLLVYGYGLSGDNSGCYDDCPWNDGGPFIKAGWATLGIGFLYSLIDTHFAVQRATQKGTWEKPFAEGIQLAPILARNANGDTRVGGQAWLHF